MADISNANIDFTLTGNEARMCVIALRDFASKRTGQSNDAYRYTANKLLKQVEAVETTQRGR